MADRNNVMQPTDETVRLIWEGMIDADRLSRYYGYLAHRLKRLSELLSIGIIGFSLATVFSIWSPLPEWLPLVTIGVVASASILTAVMRYQEKAAYSVDLYRQIERLSTDWLELWADVYKRQDAELRDAWRNLSRRQQTILERAPIELPLSNGLARRNQREADEYWIMRPNSASKTRSEGEKEHGDGTE